MTLYKLTNREMKTRAGCDNETQWALNVPVTAAGTGGLCTNGVIHCYRDPLVAVLMNPAHANFNNPRLFEAEGTITHETADKCGCRSLTLRKEIEVPVITTEQRVKFAILVALDVHKDESFRLWANKWLNGEDRSMSAAYAADAEDAAEDAAVSAARAAADAAARAAHYAAHYATRAAARAVAYAVSATNLTPECLIAFAHQAVSK